MRTTDEFNALPEPVRKRAEEIARSLLSNLIVFMVDGEAFVIQRDSEGNFMLHVTPH